MSKLTKYDPNKDTETGITIPNDFGLVDAGFRMAAIEHGYGGALKRRDQEGRKGSDFRSPKAFVIDPDVENAVIVTEETPEKPPNVLTASHSMAVAPRAAEGYEAAKFATSTTGRSPIILNKKM